MSTPVLTIQPDAPLNTALEQMQTYGVRRLVVVGLDNRIIGLVTLHQLIADRRAAVLAVLQANLQDCEEQQFLGQLLDVVGDGVGHRRGGHRPDRQDQPALSDWLGYRGTDTRHGAGGHRPNPPTRRVGGRMVRGPRRPVFRACLRARDDRDINAEISTKQVGVQRPGRWIVAVVRDLTQREAAAAALQASEQRQRLVAKVFREQQRRRGDHRWDRPDCRGQPGIQPHTGYAPHG